MTEKNTPSWVSHLFLKLDRLERLIAPLIQLEETKPAFYTISSAARKFRIARITISTAIKHGELITISKARGKGGHRIKCEVFEKWFYHQLSPTDQTDPQ